VKSSRASGTLVAAMAAVMGSCIAMANEDSGWYIGGSAGQSRAKIDDPGITDSLLAAGITTTMIKDNDRRFGYKFYGGYEFNKYIALEAGYFDLGRFGFTANTVPGGGLTGESKINGANLDAVVMLPFTRKFSAFGRVGYNYAYAKDTFVGYAPVIVQDPDRMQHSGNYKFGGGLQFLFTPSVGMRLEAERYRVEDGVGNKGDIDLFSAGLVYRFGRTAPPSIARAAPVIEPVPEAAPPPPPPPPAPPPPPVRRKVSFSADSLFDFAKDTVKPAGKQALDIFATELKGTHYQVITVTGHTDRLGSQDYNQKLSQRRADAVKLYLIEAAGIAPDKITSQGADGSDPITKPDECVGQQRTPKLIACLQPDRRVEVEVDATELQAAPQ
jgi:OOP family OmpA-OmpF porin